MNVRVKNADFVLLFKNYFHFLRGVQKKRNKTPYQSMYPPLLTSIWDAMQMTTLTLPNDVLTSDKQKEVIAYLTSTICLLPCPPCTIHAMHYLAAHPVDNIKIGTDAFRWVIDFHNDVNRRLGKREYSYKEAEESMIMRLKAVLVQKEATL